MLRLFATTLRDNARKIIAKNSVSNISNVSNQNVAPVRCLSILAKQFASPTNLKTGINGTDILSNSLNKLLQPNLQTTTVPCRTVIKFSLNKGKRKTVKAVPKRFFRLHWGIWIRTKGGRHKKVSKKSGPRRRRDRQHVFCNATQSNLLDKMVTSFWRRPRYYVDDIYQPYHTREEYYYTKKQPAPLPEE